MKTPTLNILCLIITAVGLSPIISNAQNVFTSTTASLYNTNSLEFGAGVTGKDGNAGKIGYSTFTAGFLDIVGAGTSGTNRKIHIWNEGGANFEGSIGVGIGVASPSELLEVNGNIKTRSGNLNLENYNAAGASGTSLIFGHNQFSPAAGYNIPLASLRSVLIGGGAGTGRAGYLIFQTTKDGISTDRLNIDHNGITIRNFDATGAARKSLTFGHSQQGDDTPLGSLNSVLISGGAGTGRAGYLVFQTTWGGVSTDRLNIDQNGIVIRNDIAAGGTTKSLVFGHDQQGSSTPMAAVRSVLVDGSSSARNGYLSFQTASNGSLTEKVRIMGDGKVAVGATTPVGISDWKLSVDGKIYCQELNVTPTGSSNWADYVFKSDYKLSSLLEVEKYIKENGHLEHVPSAEEVTKTGYQVGEMDATLLRKIEETTLYIIDLQKQITAQQIEISELKAKK